MQPITMFCYVTTGQRAIYHFPITYAFGFPKDNVDFGDDGKIAKRFLIHLVSFIRSMWLLSLACTQYIGSLQVYVMQPITRVIFLFN